MGSVLIEIATLRRMAPGPDATIEQVAAWYQAKARLHEHVAAGATDAEATAEQRHAQAAHEHALRLLRQSRTVTALSDAPSIRADRATTAGPDVALESAA